MTQGANLESASRRTFLLLTIRVILTLTFLLSALGIQLFLQDVEYLFPLFYLSAFVLSVSVIYLLIFTFIHSSRDAPWFLILQITGDVIGVTFLVFVTGGVNSFFTFLYNILIILGGYLLKKRGAIVIALVSGLCFGLLSLFLTYSTFGIGRFLPSAYEPPTPGMVLYYLFINYIGFFLITILVSQMVGRLEFASMTLGNVQRDLRQLRYLYDRIINSMPSGIIATDLEGNILFANTEAKKLLNDEDLNSKNLFLVLREQGIKIEAPSLPLLREYTDELELKEKRSVIMGISGLQDEYQVPEGILCILKDQTEMKKLREELSLKEQLAMAGEFAAGIAHEIRNPLGSISGSVQLLMQNDTKDEAASLLNIINKEAARLNSIVTNFLKFSKPEEINLKNSNLVSIIIDVITLFEKSLPGIEIEKYLGSEPVYALIDDAKIKQVLWNLLINAQKATEDGGKIGISLKEGGEKAIIAIWDTGIGISEMQIKNLFTPFKQSFSEGSGIGLAISEKIIKQHGGVIEAESLAPHGVTFSITIPLNPKKNKDA